MKELLKDAAPWLRSQWHPDNEIPFDEEFAVSRVKRKWLCPKPGHVWETRPHTKVNAKPGACTVCRGLVVVPGVNDLETIYPEIVSEWDFERNHPMTPDTTSYTWSKPVWLTSHGHTRTTLISTWRESSYCSVCANQTVNTGINDLASQRPDLAAEWHPTKNGNLTPEMVYYKSNTNYWWQCALRHKPWKVSLTNRVRADTGCPSCSGRVAIPGINDLATTHPKLAAQWHPTKNGDLTPEMVKSRSNLTVWWLCSKTNTHEWPSTVTNRVGHGSGCPACAKLSFVSKGENIVADVVREYTDDVQQCCRTCIRMELDICTQNLGIALEYNGVYYHSSKFRGYTYHLSKTQRCESQGIRLLHIWEDDWVERREQTEAKLRAVLSDPLALLPSEDVVEWTEDLAWPTTREIWEEAGWVLVGEEGPRLQVHTYGGKLYSIWDVGSRKWVQKGSNDTI